MQAALDALLYGISIYALPAVIALVTLLALLVWDQKYPATGATGLELKSIEHKRWRRGRPPCLPC